MEKLGSGINIPDPQNCRVSVIVLSLLLFSCWSFLVQSSSSSMLPFREKLDNPCILATSYEVGIRICMDSHLFYAPGSGPYWECGSGSRSKEIDKVKWTNKPDFQPFKMAVVSVADPDPGSGAFLTPGSGIRNRFFPDPGSQTHIFEGLVTIFWVKTSIILGKLGQIFFFSISKIK